MTSPHVSEQEVEAATKAICMLGSGKLCHPDAFKLCMCGEHARAALTAAAQVRERASSPHTIDEAIEQRMDEARASSAATLFIERQDARSVCIAMPDLKWARFVLGEIDKLPIYTIADVAALTIGREPTEPDSGPDVLGERKE